MNKSNLILRNCLYFTANSLARIITKMAEEEFRLTGLSPSHAYLLMIACEQPGIAQMDLSKVLHLAPSTVTRFIDTLVHKEYVTRKSEGKISRIYPTIKGEELHTVIASSWDNLHARYAGIIGWEEGDKLARTIDKVSHQLLLGTVGV